MGVTTRQLGHVDISPPLNQAEPDYLTLVSRRRRSFRDRGPYAVFPLDPHEEAPGLHGEAAAERDNRIADGQPGCWCQGVPCPRGCCVSWNGHEKFYAGEAWLRQLIDHFLRPGAVALSVPDVWFRRFTLDHDVNGAVVGEQDDNRELFSLTVEHGEVVRTTLRRGDRMPWDAGYVKDPLPWLGNHASFAELERREAEALVVQPDVPVAPGRRKRRGPQRG